MRNEIRDVQLEVKKFLLAAITRSTNKRKKRSRTNGAPAGCSTLMTPTRVHGVQGAQQGGRHRSPPGSLITQAPPSSCSTTEHPIKSKK